MFRSLRFRLPAIFLAGVALAGLVATLLAVRLFQDYARDQTLAELAREAAGVAALYADEGLQGRTLSAARLEQATGDKLYYAPAASLIEPFPGEDLGLRRLPPDAVRSAELEASGAITFEFTPPDDDRVYLAVAHPLRIGDTTFGAVVAAKPKTELRSRWASLIGRLAVAFGAGVIVAGALAWYLSRRITQPVLALSRAADELAEGRRDVSVPDVPAGDEIAHLADRFNEMAVRLRETEALERNFVMTVSHELRTPLTAIRGHVGALREGLVEDPALRAESLDVVAAETERLERLVSDLLDLAKLDAHRFTVLSEEVDMKRLLDQAYAAFGGEARRREIDYRQTVRATPTIVSDGDRVLQIISNLLTNAFRWTPDGGSIELELGAENGTVSVAVSDSGPGISAEERERIFRPFWTRDGGGTGLGLAIARELAGALGGRIELASAPGEGSRFELVLPAGGAG